MNSKSTFSPAAALPRPEAAPRRDVWTRLPWVRMAMQLGTLTLVLAPGWWPAVARSASIYQGNFAASHLRLGAWTLPMSDPFTALCMALSSGRTPIMLMAGAALVFAAYVLVRARAFCAFACPIHLLLEHADRLLVRPGGRRDGVGEGWPAWSNIAIAGLVLAVSAVVGQPVFEPVNPINALVRALQHTALGGLWLVAGVLVLEALLGRRTFCRHLCPIGGCYAAFNRVGGAGVAVDPAACTGCRHCTEFCLAAPELNRAIEVARTEGRLVPVESAHCTLCFECAAVCVQRSVVFDYRWKPGRRRSVEAPASNPLKP